MKNKEHSGVIVPLVTPFRHDGKIDKNGLNALLNHIIKNDCKPFVLGTTGESASIDPSQFIIAAEVMVKAAEGRCHTYAGISSNCITTSVKLAAEMKEAGVSAVVAHLPNFYPLSADAMLTYFTQLADGVKLPLLIYNIPATAHHSIPFDVVEELSRHNNIAGIKDSERNEERMSQLLQLCKDRDDFVYLSGWASKAVFSLQNGGSGVIPSTANFIPKLYACLFEAALEGSTSEAEELQRHTDQCSEIYQKGKLLSQALPGLKLMLQKIGLCEHHVLPPLLELDPGQKSTVLSATDEWMKNIQTSKFVKEVVWP